MEFTLNPLYNVSEKHSKEELNAIIIESIKECLKKNTQFRPTNLLVNAVKRILTAYLIDRKKYVICEFPTGSGKTIIGFMTFFCIQYIINRKLNVEYKHEPYPQLGYFLTSSKILQDQIDRDIQNFYFRDYMQLLKGVRNYECIRAKNDFKLNPHFRETVMRQNPNVLPQDIFLHYEYRPCKNVSGEELQSKFADCYPYCPYKQARIETSLKPLAIFNYAFFLNVMRSGFNPYFEAGRILTIADEAHLLPDIISSMFNFELTMFSFQRFNNIIKEMETVFGNSIEIDSMQKSIESIKSVFSYRNNVTKFNLKTNVSKLIDDVNTLLDKADAYLMVRNDDNISRQSYEQMFQNRYVDIIDQVKSIKDSLFEILSLIKDRPEDLFVETELVGDNKKIIIKDLNEHQMAQKNYLQKINYGLFMSATIGNIDEYAKMMGIDENEYIGIKAPSSFNFDRSPIYLCNSGKLNYANMDKNIDSVLNDTLHLCMKHQTEKGVIHTSTFKITNLLREKIFSSNSTVKNRFLFYTNASEREEVLAKFLKSSEPLILVGPSLYEGIDLKDDLARFQILVKVPYAQLSDYIKAKMKRYPFWYRHNCKEKIIQAIGRSNRHVNDWSTIYLMDSMFSDIAFELNDDITKRLRQLKR